MLGKSSANAYAAGDDAALENPDAAGDSATSENPDAVVKWILM
jgi:hypothetical protein